MSLREDMDKAISEIIKEKNAEEAEVIAFVKEHFRKTLEHCKKNRASIQTAVVETLKGLEDGLKAEGRESKELIQKAASSILEITRDAGEKGITVSRQTDDGSKADLYTETDKVHGSFDPVKQKTKEKFTDRFTAHDKLIMEAYTQKEKKSLKKELLRLENDRAMMRDHLHRLEALIERYDVTNATFSKHPSQIKLKETNDLWLHLETKLKEWENRFAKIWTKNTGDHSNTEREYADKELPILRTEKRSVQIRLINIEGIIAKACLLADDLNEDLCRNFSNGRTLAEMGEIILQEFDHKLEEDHAKGRETIRNFLERRLKISRAASRDLFSLLEEAGTLFYRVDISGDFKDMPLVYYPYDDDLVIGAAPGTFYQLNGWWEINA